MYFYIKLQHSLLWSRYQLNNPLVIYWNKMSAAYSERRPTFSDISDSETCVKLKVHGPDVPLVTIASGLRDNILNILDLSPARLWHVESPSVFILLQETEHNWCKFHTAINQLEAKHTAAWWMENVFSWQLSVSTISVFLRLYWIHQVSGIYVLQTTGSSRLTT